MLILFILTIKKKQILLPEESLESLNIPKDIWLQRKQTESLEGLLRLYQIFFYLVEVAADVPKKHLSLKNSS